jgi:hypothetical protein
MLVHAAAARRAFMTMVGGKSAVLAGGATLASVLWVGVTMPNLGLLPGLGASAATERIDVSLQSALLGIQDRVDRSSSGIDLAAMRKLGLPQSELEVLASGHLHAASSQDLAAAASTPYVVNVRHDVATGAVAPPATPNSSVPTPVVAAATAPAPLADPSTPDPSPPAANPTPAAAPGATTPAPTPPAAPRTTVVTPTPVTVHPPTIAAHADELAEATGPSGATVAYATPSAHDGSGHSLAVSCSPVSGTSFPLGSTTVGCTARDGAGNVARSSFAVFVRDTVPPALQLPGGISVDASSSAGAGVSYSAKATDAVDGVVSVSCLPASGALFPAGSTQVTCSARDSAGNTSAASFLVTVNQADFSPPSLVAPADELVEATGPGGAWVSYPQPTAEDASGATVPVSCSPARGSLFPVGSTQVSCSAWDASGNIAQSTFTVAVRDMTPPVLQLPAGISAAATSSDGATVSYASTASDAVDGSVVASCLPTSGSLFPVGSTQVTCSAQDAAGNVANSSFTVAVGSAPDTTPPAFAAHADELAEATGPIGAAVSYVQPTATDAYDGPVPVTCLPASGSLFALGTTTVSCAANDSAGNTASLTFSVIVRDTTPPTIAGHADVTAEATDAGGAAVTYVTPAASDTLDGTVAVSCLPASGSVFPVGSSTVNCSAQDAAGNVAASSFAVVVHDSTAPTIAAHADVIAEATGSTGATVAYTTPTATDNLDGAVGVSCLPASGSLFPVGSTTVSCSAHDAAGNTASSSFAVLVRDTTSPTIAAHGTVTVEAADANGATVTYTLPIASDAVDATVAVSCLPLSGSLFAVGSTPVTCSAQDGAGNSSTSTFTVRVRDTTAPTIAAHADESAEATGAAGASVAYTVPPATDAVDGAVTVTCLPASGTTFALGSTQVSCSAHDAAGNVSTSSFAVVVQDTTPPALQLPTPVTVSPTGPDGAVVSYSATASDLVDGSDSVNCLPASGSLFPLGTTTVSCSATDATGNVASGTFTVFVDDGSGAPDTTPPIISAHGDLAVEATGASGATVTYSSPTAVDDVNGPVAVDCLPASGSLFALGTTTVGCQAQDAAGNVSSSSFSVVVRDTTAPTISGRGNVTVEATGANGATVAYTAPTASDAVDGADAVACLPASGTLFAITTTTVTCTSHDAAGNSASSTFTVLVRDSTAPTIAAHANLTVEATGASGATVAYTAPTATDTVDGTDAVSCLPASGTLFALGTTTVTCTSHDAAGNTASSSFTVLVRDTTPPTIAAHANLTVEATGAGGATVAYTVPTATDTVDGTDAVSCLPASGTLFARGTTTVTCASHDAAGNTASSTFTVLVRDTTPPTIAAHANLAVEATGAGGATVAYTVPTATDTVDGTDTVSCLPASGTLFALGTATVACTSHDAAGNTASSSFTILVRDTTAPTITAPASVSANATSSSGAVVSFSVTAADLVDATDAVTCAPLSGTTFAVGHTTVTCHAHDAAANQATASFDVYVASAATQLADLNTAITAMSLVGPLSNQLTTEVNQAAQQVAAGQTQPTSDTLRNLTKQVIDNAVTNNAALTPAEGAQIDAAANAIRILLGTIAPGSGIPAAEAALFNLMTTIRSLGANQPTVDGLMNQVKDAGDHLGDGDVAGACMRLMQLAMTPNPQLTQAQLNVFTPAVNAVSQPLGC